MATIPYNETRDYVERVLYNVAAYRLRLGQHAGRARWICAENRWPTYRPQDQGGRSDRPQPLVAPGKPR